MEDPLVVLSEAAVRTGYSAEWLRRLALAGKVRHERVGHMYALPESEVIRLSKQARSPRGRPRKPAPPA